MKDKVTILTPVYNGEKYISRFIESIINQKYNNIELIIINDGSTDNTESIIKKYEEKLKKNNIELIYIYQKNAGQAAAMANGMKFVSGEYMTWGDSDDFYEELAIKKMVSYLKQHKNVDVIRCNALARDENNINKILYKITVPKKYQNKTNIFEDCIFIKGINVFAGVYMVRFKKYKENNPNSEFYKGREGQNWQILLPSLYNSNCYYLDEFVYSYVIRKNSHSHTKRNLKEQITRTNGMKEILINTINTLKLEKAYQAKLINKIEQEYLTKTYFIYCKYGLKEKIKEQFNKIKKKDIKIYIAYFIGINHTINFLYKKIKHIDN